MSTEGRRMVAYDIPLRPDLMIRITLPIDLTAEDADRVAGFVRTLVFKPSVEDEP